MATGFQPTFQTDKETSLDSQGTSLVLAPDKTTSAREKLFFPSQFLESQKENIRITSLASTVAEVLERTWEKRYLGDSQSTQEGRRKHGSDNLSNEENRSRCLGEERPTAVFVLASPFLICCVQTACSPDSQMRDSLFVFKAYFKML